jgi:SAM-dependent methyltransferase
MWFPDPVPRRVRYDGLADWYDELQREPVAAVADAVPSFLGPGDGLCLDLGCGTGLYLDAIESTGRVPVGIDLSRDQLRVARQRHGRLVCADAGVLPMRSSSVAAVTAFWISTDVDDLAHVLREVFRVLAPGGCLYLRGVHPCFNGPFVEPAGEARIVHPSYRVAGWHESSPWWGQGVRSRVGMRHVTLAELLNAIVGSGLRLLEVTEPGENTVPFELTVTANKS